MANQNNNHDFHTLGDILINILGVDSDFHALQKIRADPFNGHHLGKISDYEARKANIVNENPTSEHYEQAIQAYITARMI